MKRISREKHNFWFDRAIAPVLEIDPGEEVLLETYSSRPTRLTGPDDPMPERHPEGANPATGPILVRGAEPGDRLLVEVLDIQTDPYGYCSLQEGWGVLEHLVETPYPRIIHVEGGMVRFTGQIQFPWRPMVGVMGCAPAQGRVATLMPDDIGSNMDDNRVVVGAEVHLPVQVEGALFGLGDVHASMGDGEMSGTGIEICGEVTVRLGLKKNAPIPRPITLTADTISTYATAPNLTDAARIAAEDLHALIVKGLGISAEEAFTLMSIRADMGIAQACGGTLPATARCEFPRMFEP